MASYGSHFDHEFIILLEYTDFPFLGERQVQRNDVMVSLSRERKRRSRPGNCCWIFAGPVERGSELSKPIIADNLIAEHGNSPDWNRCEVLLHLFQRLSLSVSPCIEK